MFPLTYFEEDDVQVTVDAIKIVISRGATMSEPASATTVTEGRPAAC